MTVSFNTTLKLGWSNCATRDGAYLYGCLHRIYNQSDLFLKLIMIQLTSKYYHRVHSKVWYSVLETDQNIYSSWNINARDLLLFQFLKKSYVLHTYRGLIKNEWAQKINNTQVKLLYEIHRILKENTYFELSFS